MLTRNAIRSLTHASFYARGLDLYLQGKVEELHIRENSFVEYVSANVQGSGTKVYHVQFQYDKAKNVVSGFDCDCPAFVSYDGLCKHLIAVLLKYVSQKEEDEALSGDDPDKEADAYIVNRRISHGKPVTTPEMKLFLNRQLSRRMAPLLQNHNFGKVRLEPAVTCAQGRLSVEFRIGVSHKYVIKDIFEFDALFEHEEEYCYGKQLQFVHLPEAFDASSTRLLQFIRAWARDNRSNYAYEYENGYRSHVKLRSLLLNESEAEAFMDAVEEIPVQVYTKAEYLGWCRTAKTAPGRSLTIKGKEGGLVLQVKEPCCCMGSRHLFCFEPERICKEPLEDITPIAEFRECMSRLPENMAFIQKEDVPMFCRDWLPLLKERYECSFDQFSEAEYDVQEVCFEIYLDSPHADMISCRLIAVYGENRYNVFGDREELGQRDLNREFAAGKEVSALCNAYDEDIQSMVIRGDEELMYEFLTEGVERLQTVGQVFVSDVFRKIKINPSPRISVGISLDGELLEMTVDSDDMSREQLLEILNKYDRKKRYYRLENGEFVNVAGDSLETLLEIRQGIGLSDRQLRQERIQLPAYYALYLDEGLRERESVFTHKNREFKALVRNMKTVEDNDFEVPESLQGVLREYQRKGFLWIKTLKANRFGGILADDMGLGKTLQVIAFLCSEYAERSAGEGNADARSGRCLIVTPASLVYNWYNEFVRFAPHLPVMMVLGNAPERSRMLQNLPEQVILITSYDLLKRDAEQYTGTEFFCQVIDEAQFIKNQNTLVAKAVKEIRAYFRLALTGTPVENRLSELWSIFDFLMPGFLPGYRRFREDYEIPIIQQQDVESMERLQRIIRPFVLRRLKKDVLKDLPDKLKEDLYTRMEDEQKQLYDAHVKRLSLILEGQSDEELCKGKIRILSELTRLRQLCCDPSLVYEDYGGSSAKQQLCMELIRNAVNGGHKILLFSQFTSMLEILCNRLEEEGITFYTLTGATSKEKRKEMVEQFQEDETSVFCISLKAGGTGLNLTAADIVIHYDPWWNLAVQEQATDRAHRIGQKHAVTVYRLVTKGTIEENIIGLQEKKRELADRILGGEGVGSGSFTREELKEIIGVLL